MDKFDPNDWTPVFVSSNRPFCLKVLQDTNETVVELVRNGQYEPAVSGLDRILNGLITMQNHTDGDYRSHICFFSWMEAELIAFGIKNAPEDKRREMALRAYEDARDFARSENTRNTISAVIRDLQSGMALDALQRKHDPDFPYSVVEILEGMNSKLASGGSSPTPRSRAVSASSGEDTSGSGRPGKGLWIGLLIIACVVCLALFLWSRFTEPKEVTDPETSSSTSGTEALPTETTEAPPAASEETSATEASGEKYVVKTEFGSGLNLREGPGTDTEVIDTLEEYSVVTVLKTEGKWAYVSVGNLSGWCSMDYLVPEGDPSLEETQSTAVTATVTTESGELRLRTEPSLDSDVIKGIPKGETVTVLRQEGDWAFVDYKGTEGWCSSEFLTFE